MRYLGLFFTLLFPCCSFANQLEIDNTSLTASKITLFSGITSKVFSTSFFGVILYGVFIAIAAAITQYLIHYYWKKQTLTTARIEYIKFRCDNTKGYRNRVIYLSNLYDRFVTILEQWTPMREMPDKEQKYYKDIEKVNNKLQSIKKEAYIYMDENDYKLLEDAIYMLNVRWGQLFQISRYAEEMISIRKKGANNVSTFNGYKDAQSLIIKEMDDNNLIFSNTNIHIKQILKKCFNSVPLSDLWENEISELKGEKRK